MKMDRNHNQAVIRKLARRSQAQNHARNFFACLAITLSTALIFAFLLDLDGKQTEKLRLRAQSTHVTFESITQAQLDSLRQDDRVRWAGGELMVGRKKIGHVRLTVVWMDPQNLENDHLTYTGEYPMNDTDLMVSQEYLDLLSETSALPGQSDSHLLKENNKKMHEKIRPGNTLSLDLGDGNIRDYRISAIYDKASKSKNSQTVYASLPCAAALLGQTYTPGKEQINAIVSLKNALDMSLEDASALSFDLADKNGISPEQIKLNDVFFIESSLVKLTAGDYLTFLTVTLLILIAAGIVIHTVFYISIAGRVREYGQLRTIGMTKSQVRCLIFYEGSALALRGSLAGLVIGGFMGYALVPGGFDPLRCLGAAVLCGLLAFAAVMLSLWKPGSIASSTAPIAALGYYGYTETNKRPKSPAVYGRKTKNKYAKKTPLSRQETNLPSFSEQIQSRAPLTPDYLASLNLKRNRTKQILTLISLMLSGTLLGTITSYVVSYDPAASVKVSFPNGDYQLMVSQSSGFGGDDSLEGRMKMQSQIQAQGLLGEELRAELLSLKGVESIQPWRVLFGYTELLKDDEQEQVSLFLNGISEEDFDLLQQMSYEGVSSYKELTAQPCIVVINNYLTHLQNHPLSIGDLVPFTFYDGNGKLRKEQIPVVAVADPAVWKQEHRTALLPLSLMGSTFMMANSTLDQFAGMDTIYGYEIAADSKQAKALGTVLEELYGPEEDLYLASKMENAAYYKNEYRSTQVILYSLAVFLVVFGIINLLNTLFTNLYSRRRELGILQAVGMTLSQLQRMLSRETAHYTVISALCALIPGGLLGYALVMAQLLAGIEAEYAYPWAPILLYIIVLFILQRAFAYYGIKLLQKESLVDRMKAN